MISIDRQPWAHRGGPAFVTSKLNPIADPRCSLMNWPCSPSLFNWCCVPFQVAIFNAFFDSSKCLSVAPSPPLTAKDKQTPNLDYTSTTHWENCPSTCFWAEMDVQCLFVSTEAYWIYQRKGIMRGEQKFRRGFLIKFSKGILSSCKK